MDANFLTALKAQLASAYNDGGRENTAILAMKNGKEYTIATKGKLFSPDIVIDGENVKFTPIDVQTGQTEDVTSWTTTYERNRYVVALADIADARIKTTFAETTEKPLPPQPSESEE